MPNIELYPPFKRAGTTQIISTRVASDNLQIDGNVGIQATPSSDYLLRSERTETKTSGISHANWGIMTIDVSGPSSLSSLGSYGAVSIANTNSDAITGNLVGVSAVATNLGTGNISLLRGVTSVGSNAGVATVADYRSYYGQFGNFAGGTVSNAYGYIWESTHFAGNITNQYAFRYIDNDFGGTITNKYGLFLDDISGATTLNYAIYSAGGDVYLNGDLVRINTVDYSFPSSQAVGANYYLRNDGAGNLTWVSSSGVVSPGGADTQVQFNDSSAFNGDSNFTWNNTGKRLTLGTGISGQARLEVQATGGDTGILLEYDGNDIGLDIDMDGQDGNSAIEATNNVASGQSYGVTVSSNGDSDSDPCYGITARATNAGTAGAHAITVSDGNGNVGIGTSTPAELLDIEVSDGADFIGLQVTQNDITNNPVGVSITNAGTGVGLDITQNGTGTGLQLVNNSNGASVSVENNGSGKTIYAQIDATATGGNYPVHINASGANQSNVATVFIESNAGSTQPALGITERGFGDGIFVDKDNTGNAIQIDGDVNSASDIYGLYVDVANAGAGDAFAIKVAAGDFELNNAIPVNQILDDDTMGTANDTSLATSESIKAYVDSQVGGAGNTLDQAYDEGGAGVGRTITADSGAVAVQVPDTSGNVALTINQNDSTNNPIGVQIANAGTGDAIDIDDYKMRVESTQTTNATPFDIVSIPLAEGETIAVEATVVCQQDDESDRAYYKVLGCFYRQTAGNVTEQGTNDLVGSEESDTDWDVNWVADTGTQSVDLQVTGEGLQNINWKAIVRYLIV